MASSASKVSLKLLVDKKNQRVLFAEASKHFVDFLFTLLSLPIGTAIRLLTTSGMVGCLGNLYQSLDDLNDDYILPNKQKDWLLKPQYSTSFPIPLPLLPHLDAVQVPRTKATTFYKCSSISCTNRDLSSICNRACYVCRNYMSKEVTVYVPDLDSASASAPATGKDEGGFVKGVVTYMVMDDLVVAPMSTISSITMLNKFNIKEVCSLEEKVVEVGIDEGLLMLKNALSSKSVLNSVFLKGNVACK